jgi:endonuclease I
MGFVVSGGQSSFSTGQRGVPRFVPCSQKPPKAFKYPGLEELNRVLLYWVNGEKKKEGKKERKKEREKERKKNYRNTEKKQPSCLASDLGHTTQLCLPGCVVSAASRSGPLL